MILEIARICQSRRSTIDFLTEKRIFHDSRNCEKCGQLMKQTVKSQLSDGFVWQCSKGCQMVSLRKNSFFEAGKIPLEMGVLVLFMFTCDTPAFIAHRLIGHDKIDYESVLIYYELYRKLCSTVLLNAPLFFNEDVFVNIDKPEVEIDECLFGKKAKNDRGTSKQTTLVFGIVENT